MSGWAMVALWLAQDPVWLREMASRDLVLRVPGMERIEMLEDEGEDLPFDVYPSGQPMSPVVVLVHAGPLPVSLKTPPRKWPAYRSLGKALAASGITAVMFDHRYQGFGNQGEAQARLDEVIQDVRDHSVDWDVDPNRLAIWSFGGGSVLVSRYWTERPATMRALALYYPMLEAPAREGGPPLLVARAGQDLVMLNQAMDRWMKQARAARADVELLEHPQGDHGFEVRQDDERSREILRRTIAFLAERLKP